MRDSKKKRSRIEIIADILKYLDNNGCSRPTRMSTALNLSYDKLMDYVKELAAKGMIETNIEGICIWNRYIIHPSGINCLAAMIKGSHAVERGGK
jgi:predicted transcriptional regulator